VFDRRWKYRDFETLNTNAQAYTTYWEGDSIVITKAKTGTSGAGLRLSSDLQRFSDAYSLTLSSGVGGPAAPPPAELKKSIAQWFYEDGHLAVSGLAGRGLWVRRDKGRGGSNFQCECEKNSSRVSHVSVR
jgi:hypothetical protein